jgi:serine/threonine-protein kinase
MTEIDALLGTTLADRYRLDALLGEGGMGRVYVAEHVLMRKRLAVKVLRRELTSVPELVARFEREAMAAANIGHPNVAAATDFGKLPDGSVFLVLEYVEGRSLRADIEAGPFEPERALRILRQIASALGAAHAIEIVHRDLKPENVMLVTKGEDRDFVKVLDFGIAKVPMESSAEPSEVQRSSSPITKTGMVFGTPEYMAPEQALGQTVDGRADLYAAGVILYEMLLGVRPFVADSQVGILSQQLSKSPARFSEHAPKHRIPVEIERLCLQLLAKEVSARPSSAEELGRTIDELIGPPATKARRFALAGAASAPTEVLGTLGEVRASAAQDAAPAASGSVREAPVSERVPPTSEPEAEAEAVALASAERRQPPTIARAGALVQAWVSRGCAIIDERRARLPRRLRRVIRRVPSIAILGTGALVVLVAGTTVVAGISSALAPAEPATALAPEAPAAQAPHADPEWERELSEARAEGVAALERLAARHPERAAVAALEQADVSGRTGDLVKAIAALGRALALDSELMHEPRAALIASAALKDRAASDQALRVLQTQMGAIGAGLVYDLLADPAVRSSLRQQAEVWVRSEAFARAADADTAMAAELRYSRSCQHKHSLLPKAGEVGRARTLSYLEMIEKPVGCGRGGRTDCFPCLRTDKALAQALEAVRARVPR